MSVTEPALRPPGTAGRSSLDREIRRIIDAAEAARKGARREGDDLRPLGTKARRTRVALMAAAYEAFVANGYRATSVQEISDRAGVSLGTFYQYFREKSDVMATLVGEAIVDSAEGLFGAGHGEGRGVRRTVEAFVRNYAETADFQRVWEEVTHIEDDLARMRWDVTNVIDSMLRDGIVEEQRRGTVAADIDAGVAARALNAMIDRYCYLTFVVEGRRDDRTVDDALATLSILRDRALGL